MKKTIKRFVAIISLLLIPIVLFCMTQRNVNHNTLRIQGFYQEEKNSIDVLFFGASDVSNGFSPGLAYGEYGYTSYPYTVDANKTEFFVSQIKEALRYQSPKCIVVEITGCLSGVYSDDEQKLAVMRQFTDEMPISMNKISIINQFVNNDKLSYYFPAIAHHGQLSNISSFYTRMKQTIRGYTLLKGIVTSNAKQEYDQIMDVNDDLSTLPVSDNTGVIEELLEYCKTLDTKVLFVRFPHRITNEVGYKELKRANEFGRIIESNGFEFINFDHAIGEIGLDLENDFYSDSHLNVHGQIKLTRYFSEILTKHYSLGKSDLSQQNIERWKKSYEYTKLFYQYYYMHENDPVDYWYETPELIQDLDLLRDIQ